MSKPRTESAPVCRHGEPLDQAPEWCWSTEDEVPAVVDLTTHDGWAHEWHRIETERWLAAGAVGPIPHRPTFPSPKKEVD